MNLHIKMYSLAHNVYVFEEVRFEVNGPSYGSDSDDKKM